MIIFGGSDGGGGTAATDNDSTLEIYVSYTIFVNYSKESSNQIFTNAMMHVWCHYEFRITNMKFASVTRGSTHFQGCFEWDLRQAIFKLILVINCWNCAQTNVMGAYWSVYIGSDYYLNQCSQRSMSPYDVNGSQWLKIGRPYHIWTSFRVHFGWSILITITS